MEPDFWPLGVCRLCLEFGCVDLGSLSGVLRKGSWIQVINMVMGLERKLEVRLSTCWPVAVWTLLPWAWFIGASQERQQRCLWKQQQLREESPALPSRSAASQEDLLLLLECRTTAYSLFYPDLNTEMRLTSALWIPKPPTCWEPCFNNKVPSQPFPTSCRGFHLEVCARMVWDLGLFLSLKDACQP